MGGDLNLKDMLSSVLGDAAAKVPFPLNWITYSDADEVIFVSSIPVPTRRMERSISKGWSSSYVPSSRYMVVPASAASKADAKPL